MSLSMDEKETAVAANDLVTQAEEAEREFREANGHIAEELKEIVDEQKKLSEAKNAQSVSHAKASLSVSRVD